MRSRISVDAAILQEIVDRLTAVVGLDATSLESGRITWTLDSRCRHLGLASAAEYLEVLRSSRSEMDDLIDALVIQETRFFRDIAVFEHIGEWARTTGNRCSGPMRVLSAPCSTGQEAYSVAAMLHHAGVADFTIDAFDISRAALAAAERGVYAGGALQNVRADLQQACGALRNQHWHMHEALRRRIRFSRRNLVDAAALENESGYHLILCRNLFIYLHADARAVLADSLSRALLPEGRLIVGAGDRVPELNARFVPVKPAAGFGFVHKIHVPSPKVAVAVSVAPPVIRPYRRAAALPRIEERGIPSSAIEFYRRAVEYRDHGNLRQAERRCRQALYLAPGYLPALELLQKLWHVHPNARLHRALTARIERVRNGAEESIASAALAEGGAA